MAQNGLSCADVPLSNCSLTQTSACCLVVHKPVTALADIIRQCWWQVVRKYSAPTQLLVWNLFW